MNYETIDPGEPISRVELTRLERQMGFQVPDDYKEFLITCNGGYATPEKGIIHYYHPVRQVPGEDIGVDMFFQAKFVLNDNPGEVFMPTKCRVIADVAGGNLIVLSCRDGDYGAIYLCDLNHYNDDGNFTVKLADSFRQFYESLGPADPV